MMANLSANELFLIHDTLGDGDVDGIIQYFVIVFMSSERGH